MDIYVHTWVGSLTHLRGNCPQIYKYDTNDFLILNPHKYQVDNQDEFIKSLQFSDYFYKDIFDTYGEGRQTEWFPDLILYHLCSLESQRRVVEMVQKESYRYEKIIMLRPDLMFKGEFPVEYVLDTTPKQVFLSKHYSGEGYNDQFAIFNYSDIGPYANRIEKLKEYRATVGRIVGEKYLKHVLDTNGFLVNQIDIDVSILRE